MKTNVIHLIIATLLLFTNACTVYAQNGGAKAYAIPLEGITIDGKLTDWPDDMIRYPILNHGQAYGSTDIDNADLTASADLTPYFMVGYNPENNLIYLAVLVRDDMLTATNIDQNSTDACEVYFDSSNSNKRINFRSISDANSLAAMQYIMWPPGGSYGGTENIDMFRGSITQTKTSGEFSREGDLSIYEWAIEVFDHYPDKATKLIRGKTIGFDVVVIDKDETIDNPAWVCWGQFATLKFTKADTLVDLVLLKDNSELGNISGKVTHQFNGQPWEGLLIKVEGEKGTIHSIATTDDNGYYQVWCLPGSYNISLAVDNKTGSNKVDIKAGKRLQNIDFSPFLGSISGKVIFIDDGTTRAGISISVEEVEETYFDVKTTDVDGSYCHWIKPGNYIVSTSNARSGDSKRIKIRAGEEIKNVNFELKEIGWDDLSENERITYLTDAIKLDNALVHKVLPRSLYEYNIDPRKAVRSLFDLLKEDNPNIRKLTIDVLAKNTHYINNLSIFIESVINLLHDDDPDVRISAASALGVLGAEASHAVPVLIDLLNDKDMRVRCAAVSVLGKIGKNTETVIPLLLDMFENEETGVKIAIISALGDFGYMSIKAIPMLLKMTKKENQLVRKSAIVSLGKISKDEKEVVSLLIELLDDGYYSIRVAAVNALKEIGFNAITALPELSSMLHFSRNGSYLEEQVEKDRLEVADSIVSISQSVLNNLNELGVSDINYTIPHLEFIKGKFERDERLAGTNNERLVAINGAINGLKAKYRSMRYISIFEWVVSHQLHKKPWVLIILLYMLLSFVTLTTWFLFLWKRPLWLYMINRKLQHLEIHPESIGITIGLRQILLLAFFNYHPRVLDAWVKNNFKSAKDQFENLQTVTDRSIHVSIPITADGNLIERPTDDDFRPIFTKDRFCLLIWGEGGSGKTSLACQLSRWAMSEDGEKPIAGHFMFPVLIEHNIHDTLREQKHPLLQAIHSQVELTTGDEEIEPEFMGQLLKKQRIMVIVDRLSEMNSDTRKLVQLGYDPGLKINALIITSRIKESMHGLPINIVEPLRIDKEHLLPFMVSYLKHEDFEDSDYFDACSRLSKVAGTRGITALMAKLYAEQMITVKKEVTSLENLPDTIPDLMLGYLNWINRNRTEKDPDHRTIHRISKVIAWASMKETFRPSDASLSVVQRELHDESNLDEKLAYMSEKLGFIRFVGHSLNRIRITLDPLTEYLAGLYLLEQYGSDEKKWRQFLDEIDKIDIAIEAIEDFLFAVIDCCNTVGKDQNICSFVEPELINRVPTH